MLPLPLLLLLVLPLLMLPVEGASGACPGRAVRLLVLGRQEGGEGVGVGVGGVQW